MCVLTRVQDNLQARRSGLNTFHNAGGAGKAKAI